MAQSRSFGPSHTNATARANDRRWLLLLVALAAFAFYIATSEYDLLQPLGARYTTQTSAVHFTAETSSIQYSPVAGAPAAAADALTGVQASPRLRASVERWAANDIVLVTDGQQWDEASLANLEGALSRLPAPVVANLGNPELGPLHILVNTEGRSLSGSQPYSGPANYFSTNDGINELVLHPGQRVSTILHEIGHAYSLRETPAGHYAKVLVQPEMASYMASTGWSVLTSRDTVAQSVDHTRVEFAYTGTFEWQGLSHLDPLEDYANSFAMYYTNPDGLRAASPERYLWMAANLPR